eukprot:313639-Hanusia_phi.AAC.1
MMPRAGMPCRRVPGRPAGRAKYARGPGSRPVGPPRRRGPAGRAQAEPGSDSDDSDSARPH